MSDGFPRHQSAEPDHPAAPCLGRSACPRSCCWTAERSAIGCSGRRGRHYRNWNYCCCLSLDSGFYCSYWAGTCPFDCCCFLGRSAESPHCSWWARRCQWAFGRWCGSTSRLCSWDSDLFDLPGLLGLVFGLEPPREAAFSFRSELEFPPTSYRSLLRSCSNWNSLIGLESRRFCSECFQVVSHGL